MSETSHPWTPPRRASGRADAEALSEALERARARGDEEGGYRARMRLLGLEADTGDTARVLEHVRACLELHERDPARFPARTADGDLFEAWIRAVRVFSRCLRFDRAHVDRGLGRLAQLAERDGRPPGPVVLERLADRVANGFAERAAEELERLRETEGRGACPACAIAAEAELLLLAGREQDALAALERMLREARSCPEQPERLASRLLPALLRAGRPDDARELHLGVTRDRCANLDAGDIGENAAFCGMTGNLDRGLRLLRQALPRCARDPLRSDRLLSVFGGAAILLEATARAGYGATRVPGSADPRLAEHLGSPPEDGNGATRDFTAAELAPLARTAAERLADAYDERNGNDCTRWRLESLLELAEHSPALPLGAGEFALAAENTVPRRPADDEERLRIAHIALMAGDLEFARRTLDSPLPDLPEPLRGYQLSGRVRVRLDGRGAVDRRTAAALAEEYLAFVEEGGRRAVAAFYREAGLGVFGPIRPGGSAELAEIARRHRDPRDDRLEHAIMSLLAEHAFADGDYEGALSANLAAGEAAERLGEADLVGASGASRMMTLSCLGRWAEVDELYERLRSRPADPATRFALDYARMATASTAGRTRLALRTGERLIELLLRLGLPRGVAFIAEQTARMLALSDRREEAVERQRLAVERLRSAGDAATAARTELGRLLVHEGRAQEAVRTLEPIAAPLLADDSVPAQRFGVCEVEALLFLAYARRELGQRDRALAGWLAARDAALAIGRPQLALAAAKHFAQEAAEAGDYAAVERELRPLLPLAMESEDPDEAVTLLDLLGLSRAWSQDERGLADLRAAAGLAAGGERADDIEASFAIALAALGRTDDAVARWRSIGDEYTGEAAALGVLRAAELLASAGRPQEAIALCERAAGMPGIAERRAAEIRQRLHLLREGSGSAEAERS
ncbi:MAG: hypothetical protein Q4E05_10580, partial [Pseudoclavibacter sp.]|nr:hypothetical protein [Pseudoclavibacter sp.]